MQKELKELYAKLENAKTTPLVKGHPKCPDLWIVEGVYLGYILNDRNEKIDKRSIDFNGYEYQKIETRQLLKSKKDDRVYFEKVVVDGYLTKEETEIHDYMSTPWYTRYSGKTSPFWLAVFYGEEEMGSLIREDGFIIEIISIPDINIVGGYTIITDEVILKNRLVPKPLAKLIIIDKNDKISTYTLKHNIFTIEDIKVTNNIITILADGREIIIEVG